MVRLKALAAVHRRVDAAGRSRLLSKLAAPIFFVAVRTRVVTADEVRDVDPELQTLRDLNTPEVYEAVLREISV